jgi:hypothetical protein
MDRIEAKPTQYSQVLFRSRLEATYARYFGACKVQWEYEPHTYQIDAFQWYTPDFIVWPYPGHPVFVEVKPTEEEAYEDDRMRKLSHVYPGIADFVIIAGRPTTGVMTFYGQGHCLETYDGDHLVKYLLYRHHKFFT